MQIENRMTVGVCWKVPQLVRLDTKFLVPAQSHINCVLPARSGPTVPQFPPPCVPSSSDSLSFGVISACTMTQIGIWILKVWKASTSLCGTILES